MKPPYRVIQLLIAWVETGHMCSENRSHNRDMNVIFVFFVRRHTGTLQITKPFRTLCLKLVMKEGKDIDPALEE